MLFCLANLATSLIFLMESRPQIKAAMPLRGAVRQVAAASGAAAGPARATTARSSAGPSVRAVQRCPTVDWCSGVDAVIGAARTSSACAAARRWRGDQRTDFCPHSTFIMRGSMHRALPGTAQKQNFWQCL